MYKNTFDLENGKQQQDGSNVALTGEKSSGGCSKSRIILIVVIVSIILALALGLGLGLGLKSSEEEEMVGCRKFVSVSRNKNHKGTTGEKWRQKGCPAEGIKQCPDGFSESPLIVVSMDGFRPDYLQRNVTHNIQHMIDCGVRADYMRPAFPTKTFVNHYSVVTGLYPESSGIVDNKFFDPNEMDEYIRGSRESYVAKWWQGEPDRVDQVLQWLQLPESDRPSLIMLYFHQPDRAGHYVGPYHEWVTTNVSYVDQMMGRLMDGLQELELDQCVNLMMFGDHGMTSVDCGDVVHMPDLFDVDEYLVYDGAIGRVNPAFKKTDDGIVEKTDPESVDELYEKLACRYYNNSADWYLDLYRKKDLPKRMHYANSDRIDDLVYIVEDQWLILKEGKDEEDLDCEGGDHGHDNINQAMRTFFVAHGPGFKQTIEVEPFENIEVYNLMADLLNMTPAPNNGTKGRLYQIMTDPPEFSSIPAAGDYRTCDFPSEDEIEARRNSSDCTCNDLGNDTDATVPELDERLNLDPGEITASLAQHLPYGIPELEWAEASACQLTQHDYITGYSHDMHMPLWSAFRVQAQSGSSVLSGAFRIDVGIDDCVRPDVRLSLEEQTQCSDYKNATMEVEHTFLFPKGLVSGDNQSDALISSNLVPMFKGFKNGIWRSVLHLMEEYAEKYDDIRVLAGPVFDYNNDGLMDLPEDIEMYVSDRVPLPTHYYMILSRCDEDDCASSTHVMAVVVPHRPTPGNCYDYQFDSRLLAYTKNNVARVRDIELLTGLRTFVDVPTLVTRAKILTDMAVGLWERISWTDIESDQCHDLEQPDCPEGFDAANPPVILISLDGFRADYLERGYSPTLHKLSNCGVSAPYMRSIYPTLTFPNHYSLATGLYAESHGIVDNNMYDMGVNESFFLGSDTSFNPHWWGGEPIWNTVTRNNKTAMCFFWPGSDVEIGGNRPSDYYIYNGDIPYSYRVDQVLKWLEMSPDLVILYLSKVDSVGHDDGPDSLGVNAAIGMVDGYIKMLMDGLYHMGLHKCANIFVTADHGMSDISCDRSVQLNDYLGNNLNKMYVYPGTAGRLGNTYIRGANFTYYEVPEESRVPLDEVVENVTCKSDFLSVFLKDQFPTRYHYTNNERIEGVLGVLQDRWQVNSYSPWCPIIGQHGWDPTYEKMQALFLAYGPSLKDETVVDPFETIELYNLLSHLLGVEPSPNNGTQGSLFHLLRDEPSPPSSNATQDYEDCDYPTDDAVYTSRANLTTAGCQCIPPDVGDILNFDERLKFAQHSNFSNLEAIHLPHGIPGHYDWNLCQLYHKDFISAFSADIKMPVWSAFTLTDGQISNQPDPVECLRPDVRLESNNSPLCLDYDQGDYEVVTLFPAEFASEGEAVMDTAILSNTVPMLENFFMGVWQELIHLVSSWAEKYSLIHIITGPVFDHDFDGRRDNITELPDFVGDSGIPVPSHYYMVILRCDHTERCQEMDYEVQAFSIPHKPNTTNCMTNQEYIFDNRVRIRDIELLTGLEFLTANSSQQSIQTRTLLPTNIWDR